MEVKVFRVSGKMFVRNAWQKFSIELTGLKREHVIEEVYSLLGSRHKLKRSHIKIEEVREISPNEVENPNIRKLLILDRIIRFQR